MTMLCCLHSSCLEPEKQEELRLQKFIAFQIYMCLVFA